MSVIYTLLLALMIKMTIMSFDKCYNWPMITGIIRRKIKEKTLTDGLVDCPRQISLEETVVTIVPSNWIHFKCTLVQAFRLQAELYKQIKSNTEWTLGKFENCKKGKSTTTVNKPCSPWVYNNSRKLIILVQVKSIYIYIYCVARWLVWLLVFTTIYYMLNDYET